LLHFALAVMAETTSAVPRFACESALNIDPPKVQPKRSNIPPLAWNY
jgi:hypothetical protein